MSNNLTFVIFTYNEEKRIERVIRNFKNYGKILLNDDNSNDRTHEIALSYGCEIMIREKNYDFAENQEMVNSIYERVTTDWIFWGFADEMMEKQTLMKIKQTIDSEKYDIINIDRKNYFFGSFCFDVCHSYNNKIFKKHAIDFTDNVMHGMGTPNVPLEKIYKMPDKYFVHHFISNNVNSYLNVINKYTTSEINSIKKAKVSIWYFLFIFLKAFVKDLIINRGFKNYAGIALTELTLFYFLIKNMKIYEKENEINVETIEERNNAYRESILREF